MRIMISLFCSRPLLAQLNPHFMFNSMNSLRHLARCQGDGNYTHILLSNRKITVARTLRKYEELLSAAGFVRIHQSRLVQTRCIAAYYKQDGSYLKLKGGI